MVVQGKVRPKATNTTPSSCSLLRSPLTVLSASHRFSCYGVVVLIEMLLGLVFILIIPFCESLIKETLNSALETYASKMRLAIVKELEKKKDKN